VGRAWKMFLYCSEKYDTRLFRFSPSTTKDLMDFAPYIHWNRDMLLRLIAVVFDSMGLGEGERPVTVTRAMRLKVLHTLRPAESALRRMIFALAVEMESKGYVPPKWVARAGLGKAIERGDQRVRVPAFRLIDPRKWFWWIGTTSRPRAKHMPWITCIGYDDRARPEAVAPPVEPTDDDPMDAESLCHRLLALKGALDDLPKQAKRMLRLKARTEAQSKYKSPLRPGLPPGWRARGRDEIDEVLRECHKLAVRAKQWPDTG